MTAVQLAADLLWVSHGLHCLDCGLLSRDPFFLQSSGVVLQVGGQFLTGQTLGGGQRIDAHT